MNEMAILDVLADMTKVFGVGARAVSLHFADTMLAKPIAGAGAYFNTTEEEIAAARLTVARKCQADLNFAVKLAQCKVDAMKAIKAK